MADYRAIGSVCESVIQLLRMSYEPASFNNELEFKVFTSKDFANPISNGVSLFLYRVFPNGTHRAPAGRPRMDGKPAKTRLPLDLHFLLTVWGKEASLQHAVAGWMMRTLEDTPVLSSGILNAVIPDVFRADENVELSLTQLANEDLLRIWEILGLGFYQLSVPYVARVVHLEGIEPRLDGGGPPVQEREPQYAVL